MNIASVGDYSTSEADTGFKWIDGKAIYKKTVSLSVSASSGEQIFTDPIPSVATQIIRVEGGLSVTAGSDYYPLEYVNPGATTLQNMQLKFSKVAGSWQLRYNSGASGTLTVTTFYTK